MLKIKDNVNLKELEKFGFKEIRTIKGYIYYYDIFWACGWYIEVLVKSDRTISLNVNYESLSDDIDILFDLIQAGLVEKVA